MKKHCWHEIGPMATNTFVSMVRVVCCNCGVKETREYRDKEEQLSGHGKYYISRTRASSPVECDVECEES